MEESFEFLELKSSLNDFKIQNNLLIEKCEQISHKLRAMRKRFITTNFTECADKIGLTFATGANQPIIKGNDSVLMNVLGDLTSAMNITTTYGTDLTKKVILRIICSELRQLAEHRSKVEKEVSAKLSIIVRKGQGPISDLYFIGVSSNGVSFRTKDVLKRMNGWNGKTFVEGLTQLIKDLYKDKELIVEIQESFDKFSSMLRNTSLKSSLTAHFSKIANYM